MATTLNLRRRFAPVTPCPRCIPPQHGGAHDSELPGLTDSGRSVLIENSSSCCLKCGPSDASAATGLWRSATLLRQVEPQPCAAVEISASKVHASAAIDSAAAALDELSICIHSHPELNYEEVYAHDTLTHFFENSGFRVQRSYLDLKTAFLAEVGSGKPVVAICAEYDALPEIGHACGHNLISSAAVAAALGVKAALETESSSGTVRVLGTPAEESGGGKIELIDRGAFKDVDFSLMVHPAPADLLYPAILAIERVIFEFFGKNAHAAAAPFDGVNALDAVVQTFNNVGMARQQFRATWKAHGIITHGGVKANIIPDYTRAEFFVRAPTVGETQQLKKKVVACAEGAAAATGCRLKHGRASAGGVVDLPYRELNTNSVLAELYGANARQLGKKFLPRAVEASLPSGSTDMGDVSFAVPAIHPCFKIPTKAGEGNHHPGFTRAAGTAAALQEARTAGKAMSHTVLDVLCRPDLVPQMRAEFEKSSTM